MGDDTEVSQMPSRAERNAPHEFDFSQFKTDTERPTLSEDVEQILSASFQRSYLDLKKKIIKNTVLELEAKTREIVSSHNARSEIISSFAEELKVELLLIEDDLKGLHSKFLAGMDVAGKMATDRFDEFRESFCRKLSEESKTIAATLEETTNTMSSHENIINNLLEDIKKEFSFYLESLQTEHQINLQELSNKSAEEGNMLKMTLQNDMDELNKALEEVSENYLDANQQKIEDFKFLLKKDEDLSEEIQTKMDDIESCQKQLRQWKEKLSRMMLNSLAQVQALKVQKESKRRTFYATKAKLKELRQLSRNTQRKKTKTYETQVKKLREALNYGKQILHFIKLSQSQPSALSSDISCNIYLLQAIASYRQQKGLNQELAKALSDIKAGTSVPPDVMEMTNPLLVIKGNVILGEEQRKRSYQGASACFIDGNLMLRSHGLS